jgi:hypothetical protein
MGGPISVCKVPVNNQQKRLVSDLSRVGLIKDGKIIVDTSMHYIDSFNDISNKLYFLESRDALGFIKTFDKNNLIRSSADSINVGELLALFRLNSYNTSSKDEYWNAYFLNNKIVDVSGFDHIIPLKSQNSELISPEYLSIDHEGNIQLFADAATSSPVNISKDIYTLSLNPDGSGVLDYTVGAYQIKILVQSASGEKKSDKITVTDIQGLVFIRKNQ